jgi:HD-like signal output (HDOD) protein
MTDRSKSDTKDPVLAHGAAIIEAAARLRPLSHSTAQLVALTAQLNVSTSDFVAVISHDQVLAATLLREANSAASAARNPINTVDSALVRLGTSRVLSLAVRMSVSDQMATAVPEYDLSDGDLALLSVVGSIAAELVRERSKVALPPELPTAALLRDIGMLVLATFLDAPHLALLHVAREAGAPLSDSERMVLDADHGEVGGLLCQAWKLPDSVRLGVQYHHDPFACEAPIAHAVFLADTIAHRIAQKTGHTWSHSDPQEAQWVASMAELRIEPGTLDALVEATLERFHERDTGLTL